MGTEVGSTCLAARTDDELRSLLLQGLDKTVHHVCVTPPHTCSHVLNDSRTWPLPCRWS